MWRTTGWVAKQAGVTRMAINKWIRQGRYPKIQQTPGGHYRIWIPSNQKKVGYCRASSAKQKSSIESQSDIIRKRFGDIEIISDIGSGFNFRRRGFKSLLERCLRGEPIEVVVTTGDRLARGGLPFIKWAIELHGGSVVELEKGDSDEEFDSALLVGFITSFVASYHGKRSSRRKKSSGLPGKL